MHIAVSAFPEQEALIPCLQDFEAKGGKVVVPVGCNGLEDWLLDNVEVPKLLPLLKKGPHMHVQLVLPH